ncbi:MAG: RluA family pseudouridine synthase [Gammaproteobacteria bacterium]|nr:RluA family pseudouridine synthase [Gammaproteobacteria bacterium]
MTNIIKVNIEYINQRLDNFLFRELKNAPKSLIYRLVRKGAIRVNGKRVKPEHKLLLNDEIKLPNLTDVKTPEDRNLDRRATNQIISNQTVQNLKKRIIYENNDFLILNKPSGLAVHAGSNVKFGVVDILRKLYGEKFYLELVHRLDRDTSGCLMIAKSRIALQELHTKIQEREINKTYLALVKKSWPNSKRLINHPLRKSVLQGGERMVVVDPAHGKASLTRVEVKAIKNNTSLLQLQAVTGRTHQLRVHCAFEGYPIIGDSKYGDKELNKEVKNKANLKRIFLHAYKLEFNWGKASNLVSVTADLEPDLEATLGYFDYI